MRAGKLRRPVTIEQRNETGTDDYGQPVEVWQTFATPFAAIEDLEGREFLEAAAQLGSDPIRVRIRWRSGIERRMRVVIDSTTYKIESIQNPDRRNRELVLLCTREEGAD